MPELADHLLRDVWVLFYLGGIEARQHQPASLATFAVTGCAVLPDHLIL